MKIKWIFMLLVILSPLLAHSQEEVPFCGVEIIKEQALFFFPTNPIANDDWVWYQDETPENALEYSWEIAIPSNAPVYSFGAYIFNFTEMSPKKGKLSELLQYAQKTVSRVKNETSYRSYEVESNLKIKAKVQNDGVVLGILDKETYDIIFADRPEGAIFRIRHPNPELSITCNGKITYHSN